FKQSFVSSFDEECSDEVSNHKTHQGEGAAQDHCIHFHSKYCFRSTNMMLAIDLEKEKKTVKTGINLWNSILQLPDVFEYQSMYSRTFRLRSWPELYDNQQRK